MLKRILALVLPVAFLTVFAVPAMAGGGWHGGHHDSFNLSLGFGFPAYPAYPRYYAYPYPYPAPVYYGPPVVYAPPPVVYAPPVTYAAPPPAYAAAPNVSAVPTRDFRDNAGRYCREYQRTAVINGRQQQVYGTACQMPDGSWRIVNE
jgi:hypothetical protein